MIVDARERIESLEAAVLERENEIAALEAELAAEREKNRLLIGVDGQLSKAEAENERLREERDAEERRSILLTEDCCRLREWQRKACMTMSVLADVDIPVLLPEHFLAERLIAEAEGV